MFFRIDELSKDLPKDVVVAARSLDLDVGRLVSDKTLEIAGESDGLARAKVRLSRYYEDTQIYSEEIAGKMGFFANLFFGDSRMVKAGVIHEAKRYRLDETENDRPVEIGVSVRLLVATSAVNAKFDLTIPNLAAQAQLNSAKVRIGISVIGYVGPLGDLLRSPDQLDVENYSIFMGAFEQIKKQIFGADGLTFISPELLAFDPLDDFDLRVG